MKVIARTVKGYRKKRTVKKGGFLGSLLSGLMGSRRRRPKKTGMRKKRVIHRGGFLGNILKGVHNIVKSVPVISTALKATGNPLAGTVASSLGYRKRRVRRMGGFKRQGYVSFGGFKRRGNVSYGGVRMSHPKNRLIRTMRVGRPGMLGMRKRRVHKGRGLLDLLRKGHDFVKSQGLVSKGLQLIPHKYAQIAAPIAQSLGYRRSRSSRPIASKYLPGTSYF